MGMVRAAARELIEIIPVKKNMGKNTAMEITKGRGKRPRKTPPLVATPFPPFQFKKGVQICPAMAHTPPSRA